MKHFKKLRKEKQAELISYVYSRLELAQGIGEVKYCHDARFSDRLNYFSDISEGKKWIEDSGLDASYVECVCMDYIIDEWELSFIDIKSWIEDKVEYDPNVFIFLLIYEMLEGFWDGDSVEEAMEHINNL